MLLYLFVLLIVGDINQDLKLRYCIELLPAEWKISRTCCTSSETTLLQKEVQVPARIENSSGLGYCLLVINKRSTGLFATWQCLILGRLVEFTYFCWGQNIGNNVALS